MENMRLSIWIFQKFSWFLWSTEMTNGFVLDIFMKVTFGKIVRFLEHFKSCNEMMVDLLFSNRLPLSFSTSFYLKIRFPGTEIYRKAPKWKLKKKSCRPSHQKKADKRIQKINKPKIKLWAQKIDPSTIVTKTLN